MTFTSQLGTDFHQTIKMIGLPLRIKYYNTAYPGAGSYYDDDRTLSQSGSNLWISGIVMPVRAKEGSDEAYLMSQGRILMDDKAVYINGSISTSGIFQIGIGSPPTTENAIIGEGVTSWTLEGTSLIKKLYVRNLTTGSLT